MASAPLGLACKPFCVWTPPTFSALSFSPLSLMPYILTKLVCLPCLRCALNLPFLGSRSLPRRLTHVPYLGLLTLFQDQLKSCNSHESPLIAAEIPLSTRSVVSWTCHILLCVIVMCGLSLSQGVENTFMEGAYSVSICISDSMNHSNKCSLNVYYAELNLPSWNHLLWLQSSLLLLSDLFLYGGQ